MTENRVFQIMLQDNADSDYTFDYPTLQKDAVTCIAKKFTDIIYDTLKQKSSASNIKRGNVLKYINSLCEVKECHLNDETYKCFLKVVRNSFKTVGDEKLIKLFCEINSDMKEHMPKTFTDEVVAFYKKKHSRQKENIKNLEFIKMIDQEKVNTKYDVQIRKNFSYYETNEHLIRNLLDEVRHVSENKPVLQQIENIDYRERQIKLAYALVNLKNENTNPVERILQRLSGYAILQEFEINFIQYLWAMEDTHIISSELLAEKFPFILERIILRYSTDIVLIKEKNDVDEYFIQLTNNQDFSKMRKICQKNSVIHHTLKNLIYELYYYSYCNENIIKLTNFII